MHDRLSRLENLIFGGWLTDYDLSIDYKINDPDGFSNLRAKPSGAIVKKVYENELFKVIGEEDNHKKVALPDGTMGYIHNSRVARVNKK